MANRKRLYIRTEKGAAPIDPALAEKYGLKAGMKAPFSAGLVLDADEAAGAAAAKGRERIDAYKGELVNDNISQIENGVTMQTSEMIDFSKAEDSVVRTGDETY